MKVTTLESGLRGIDTVLVLKSTDCHALWVAGVSFVVRYLPSLTLQEVEDILNAGLALSVVTYANSFDPSDEIRQLSNLGLPKGIVVWLDVEGVKEDPLYLQKRINTWANALKAAGYIPGMYVGAGALLTSKELYALAVVRYWHSVSRVTDRYSAEAAPSCGWVMHQLPPFNTTRAGITVDVNVVCEDYKGRTCEMVTA